MNVQRSGRPSAGATIDAPGYGRCLVLDHTDPSVMRLQTATATEVTIGKQALRLALLSAAGENYEGAVDGLRCRYGTGCSTCGRINHRGGGTDRVHGIDIRKARR